MNTQKFDLKLVELFCKELKRQCQKLGTEYSSVHVRGFKFLPFKFGYISFSYYLGDKDIPKTFDTSRDNLRSTTCPNMNYPDIPNDGGEFYILKK